MSRGNQTGPLGLGPMTGRRMGVCVGNDQAGSHIKTFGQGLMNCFRGSRGGNGGFYKSGLISRMMNSQNSSKEIIENEIDVLKKRLSYLESELKNAN